MLPFGRAVGTTEGKPMRGRKPRAVEIAPEALPVLEQIARTRSAPSFQVRHARIVLAVAAGQRVGALASAFGCDPSTVWRVCRRYERGGVAALLAEEPRPGRPPEISPPCSGRGSSN